MGEAKRKRNRVYAFHHDRREAARKLSVPMLKSAYEKWDIKLPERWNDRAMLVMLHKLRVNETGAYTDEQREESRAWLVENHYSTRMFRFPPNGQFILHWHDLETEATQLANPDFLNGMNIDASEGALLSCFLKLPYPAPRVGQFHIGCKACGLTALVTTAGRLDDPVSIRLKCRDKEIKE